MDNINKKLCISEPGVYIGSIDDSNATYELFGRKYTEEELKALVESHDKLEQALDKACEELANQNDGEYWRMSEPIDNKEEWKDWCLEDE